MKDMEVMLYRMRVLEGKEDIAKEWLLFLTENKERAAEIIVDEKVYYEAYFTAVENDIMYIYATVAAENIEFANQTAWNSKNELDKKHFEYMKSCIDIENSLTIPSSLQLNAIK